LRGIMPGSLADVRERRTNTCQDQPSN
jgi:hypothetical protein